MVAPIGAESAQHDFALSEAAWEAIEQQATTKQLRRLTLLALIGEHEINFWNWRIRLLESPDRWPLLTDREAGA